jgi:hypothetical protein
VVDLLGGPDGGAAGGGGGVGIAWIGGTGGAPYAATATGAADTGLAKLFWGRRKGGS